MNLALVRLFVGSNIAWRVADGPLFEDLMKLACPNWQYPSEHH